jgi:hypothetical protein
MGLTANLSKMASSLMDVCHLGKSIPIGTFIFYFPSPFFSEMWLTGRLRVLNGIVGGIQKGILKH